MELSIEALRYLFISYQSQFYNNSCAYSLIAQSDQQRVIEVGGYDDYILKNFEIVNGSLKKKKK